MLGQQTAVLGLAALLSAGCAEHLGAFSAGGFPNVPPPVVFWPPPPSTSVWSGKARGETFGEVAEGVTRSLRGAGYDDARWYPIGVDFVHGFAAVTRLERIDADGTSSGDRWCDLYPKASNLRWLEGARAPALPGAGHFRVFLVALTDLPLGAARAHAAPRSNDTTLMDAAELHPMTFPKDRRVSSRFHLATFVYEYTSEPGEELGTFVPIDEHLSAAAHVSRAKLASIAEWDGGVPQSAR
ncbi:MAG TPA: hypothetical protein VGI39_27175 [Polyangiaceae bacterium]